MKRLTSAASVLAALPHARRAGLLLLAAVVVLSAGAERHLTPRGGDPVAEMRRILDRIGEERYLSPADRRKQLDILADLAGKLTSTGDLSRAVELSWFGVEDADVGEIQDKVIRGYVSRIEDLMANGNPDQRLAAINILAATVRGARTRVSEPQKAVPIEGAGTGAGVPSMQKFPLQQRPKTNQPSPANFRNLRARLQGLAPNVIRQMQARPEGREGEEIQAACARALGEMEAESSLIMPPLEGVLRSGGPIARRAAVGALETILRIVLPQEQSLTGGTELVTPQLAGSSLRKGEAQDRLKTMGRILAILPMAIQDRDTEVRFAAARIYHRMAYALSKSPLVPPRAPSAEERLDSDRLRDYQEGLEITRTLLAEITPLNQTLRDQAGIMARAAQDSDPEVRIEMCHAIERAADTMGKVQRVKDALLTVQQRLEHQPPPSPAEKKSGPSSDRDRNPPADNGPTSSSARPRNQDLPSRRSLETVPVPVFPGQDTDKASSPAGPPLSQAPLRDPSTPVPLSITGLATEYAAQRSRARSPGPPGMDALLPPSPASQEEAVPCSAYLDAPVAVPLAGPGQAPPQRLALQADQDNKPEILPEPRPAPEVVDHARQEFVRAAMARLKDPSIRVRLAGLDVLEGMGKDAQEAVPALIEALHDSSRFVRWQSARILGRLAPAGAEEAVPALMKRLNEYEDTQARMTACAALEQYARENPNVTAQAVPLLARVLHHGEMELRLEVLATLRAIGRPAVAEALPSVAWSVKIDKEASVRAAAARVLGYFGELSQRALPTLRRALNDEDPEVRRAANEAILSIPPAGRRR